MPSIAESPSLNRMDEHLLTSLVSSGYVIARDPLFDWMEREAGPGESLIDVLSRRGLLRPQSRQMIQASLNYSPDRLSPSQLFTPDGLAWLDDLASTHSIREPLHEEHPTFVSDNVPGVTLTDTLESDPKPSHEASSCPSIVGIYRLIRPLNNLGMNDLGSRREYEAESVFGGDRVAVKLMPTRNASEQAVAQQFLNGAAVAQHLQLPGCLPVLTGAHDFGNAFVVTPLLPNGSVQDLHDNRPHTPQAATAWCAEAARTLAAVHAAGFAHGNIKPGNLLFGSNGILLADFKLPDQRVSPALQKQDVSALVHVYAKLLSLGGIAPPASCLELTRRTHTDATSLAEAFDAVSAGLNSRTTSWINTPITGTIAEAQPERRTPQVGDVLGKCVLVDNIGKGATGVVFRALHQTLEIDVAVKVLSSVAQSPQQLTSQFTAEARMLARLNHPNIVRIWDYEARSEFPPYLVLEYVNGKALDEQIKQVGTIRSEDAVPIFTQVILGLAAAHKLGGLVHRDIKPANILLGQDGLVKVADLGLASMFGTEQDFSTTVVGTPAYMAPELLDGGQAADHRSDIYSLGITLYEALTGQLPFTGKSKTQVMYKHVLEQPVPPAVRNPAIPTMLSDVVVQMLAKKPADRFQTYDALLSALAEKNTIDDAKAGAARDSGTQKSSMWRLFSR